LIFSFNVLYRVTSFQQAQTVYTYYFFLSVIPLNFHFAQCVSSIFDILNFDTGVKLYRLCRYVMANLAVVKQRQTIQNYKERLQREATMRAEAIPSAPPQEESLDEWETIEHGRHTPSGETKFNIEIVENKGTFKIEKNENVVILCHYNRLLLSLQ